MVGVGVRPRRDSTPRRTRVGKKCIEEICASKEKSPALLAESRPFILAPGSKCARATCRSTILCSKQATILCSKQGQQYSVYLQGRRPPRNARALTVWTADSLGLHVVSSSMAGFLCTVVPHWATLYFDFNVHGTVFEARVSGANTDAVLDCDYLSCLGLGRAASALGWTYRIHRTERFAPFCRHFRKYLIPLFPYFLIF